MIDLTVGVVIGVVLGAVGVLGLRRSTPAPLVRAPAPDPGSIPAPTPAETSGPVAEPAVDAPFHVAAGVLDVADRLTSAELRRRLAEALLPLPGVVLIAPAPGETFDPDLHVWDSTVDTESETPESVARTSLAGLYAPDGTVARRARVAVHDRPAVPEPRNTP